MKNLFQILTVKISIFLSKIKEPWYFNLLIILNLVPGFYRKILPSMDGGAHLYNSQLINSLIFDANTKIYHFFKLNPEIVPNWTGHFILSIFNYFLPAFLAEKILLTICLVGLPLVFRNFIKTIAPQNIWLSYFVFLFTYHFLFLLGFYNYSLAIILLFITLNYWIKTIHKKYSIRNIIILIILIALTYFSHIFVFALLVFVLSIYLIFATIYIDDTYSRKKLNFLIQKLIVLLISSIGPLILFTLYFYNRPNSGIAFYQPIYILFQWITDTRSLIVYNYDKEALLNRISGFIILLLFIYLFTYRLINYFKKKEAFFKINDFLFIVALVALILLFILPDSDGLAGFVSVRLGFIFIIFFSLGLSSGVYPKNIKSIALLIILTIAFVHNFGFNKAIKTQYKIVQSIQKVADYIPSNAIVLPINFSKNWLAGNYSNYLGVDKPLIILNNYEASTGYFPVLWNRNQMPTTLLGNAENIPNCLEWITEKSKSKVIIDYVFVLIDNKNNGLECIQPIETEIRKNYKLIYSDEFCMLYQNNKI